MMRVWGMDGWGEVSGTVSRAAYVCVNLCGVSGSRSGEPEGEGRVYLGNRNPKYVKLFEATMLQYILVLDGQEL
jgi:hypothetical protein